MLTLTTPNKIGSPPPTRGAHWAAPSLSGVARITPAYAGSTPWTRAPTSGSWDHPRLRGEHLSMVDDIGDETGSPPPTRGAPGPDRRQARPRRITPAYAGSTQPTTSNPMYFQDHPHLRGEHLSLIEASDLSRGSPPPTRRALARFRRQRSQSRITPTYAGSTRPADGWSAPPQDHPHLRGEHRMSLKTFSDSRGSPPPTRGALNVDRRPRLPVRITPTYAGSTRQQIWRRNPCTDHPHLRGEHRQRQQRVRVRRRITPTYAGSTHHNSFTSIRIRDHPHLRGEHIFKTSRSHHSPGSPPPTRGARDDELRFKSSSRITPTYAGSTHRRLGRPINSQDHPHLRGEHTTPR